jgi:uroporphyrinogen decarboxylase
MNSREIVRRTVEFEGPERVARSFGASDFQGCSYTTETPSTDWREVGGGRWERTDEWGNLWSRVDPTSKGEVVKGVLESLGDLDGYVFPDFSHAEDYEKARRIREEHPDMWVIGGVPGFAFNIARKLRKLDQYFMDLLIDRERIAALHDRIDAFVEDMIRNYAAIGVDAIMFCEDWGTQAQLLVDPVLWREEFGPRYQRLCGLAHGLGVKVFLHSCGQIEAVVPDMMEAGVDLMQFDQPELHGLDVLAAHQERGKITFWCPVDIQTILQSGDEELIRSRARAMLDALWSGRGGFVAGFYDDNPSIGLDPKWQEMACDEFTKHGVI